MEAFPDMRSSRVTEVLGFPRLTNAKTNMQMLDLHRSLISRVDYSNQIQPSKLQYRVARTYDTCISGKIAFAYHERTWHLAIAFLVRGYKFVRLGDDFAYLVLAEFSLETVSRCADILNVLEELVLSFLVTCVRPDQYE